MKNHLLSVKKTINLFIVLLLSVPSLQAQNWNQILKTVAGDRQDKTNTGRSDVDYFGYSVAISGSFAIVGTPNEDEDEVGANVMDNSGAAYLFYNNAGTWKKVKKLVASNRSNNASFGSSVAINGNYIVIGAPNDSKGQFPKMGAAYIFKKDQGGADNWGEVKIITSVNRAEFDLFGTSVSISNDYVFVGAYREDQDSEESATIDDAGAVYIFKKDFGGTENWGQTQKITAPNRDIWDNFGFSVAVDGDQAVIGAYQENEDQFESNPISDSGSAYIFKKDEGSEHWSLVKKITASIRSGLDQFGYSVAISGNNIIVGAIGDDDRPLTNMTYISGAAYIFSKDFGGLGNWGQVKKLISFDRNEGDNFGFSVSISGNYAVAGALSEGRNSNNEGTYAGSAYVFGKDKNGTEQWGLAKKIVPYSRSASSGFGCSVSINGNYVLSGSFSENWSGLESVPTNGSGSAYVFYNNPLAIDNWEFQQQLAATTDSYGSFYGSSISTDGQYTIVGAPNDGGKKVGAAYILQNVSGKWTQIKKITPDIQLENGYFGRSLALSGDYAVVGAYGTNSFAGAVYIFKKDQGGVNNWGLLKKLTNPQGIRYFGLEVSISGENILIGSSTDLNTFGGSAHIYNKNFGGADNWGYFQKILPPVLNPLNYFGASTSISGDTLIVGSPNDEPLMSGDANNSGAAYIFAKTNEGIWQLVKKIVASDRMRGDSFGTSVYLNGENVFVGAPSDNRDANGGGTILGNSGSVYIFKRTTNVNSDWLQVKKITAPIRSKFANFGLSIGISGNYAVIGSSGESDSPGTTTQNQTGAAYILKNNGGANNWTQVQRIQSNSRSAGDSFSQSTAINGRNIFIGAGGNAVDLSDKNAIYQAGAVFIFIDNTPLPVTLSEFEVKKMENQAVLKWTTTSETNSDYFEIQKSSDGVSWRSIGIVNSAEDSEKSKTYTFVDTRPNGGENLYRLKMFDLDATFAYSRIRSLSFAGLGLTIYPNPVSDKIFFTHSELSQIESVRIVNNQGKAFMKIATVSSEGIAINQLSTGMYFVQIRKTDGSTQINKIFVVR